jgi:hypothetical protein
MNLSEESKENVNAAQIVANVSLAIVYLNFSLCRLGKRYVPILR